MREGYTSRVSAASASRSREGALLRAVLRYEFHGILHFELRYSEPGDPEGTVRVQRVAAHQVYADPKAGDRIRIEELMGLVHRVSKVEPGA